MRVRSAFLLSMLFFAANCYGAQAGRDLRHPSGVDTYIACGKRFSAEVDADKAVANCPKEKFSCEQVAERGVVSLIKGKIPSLPKNYKGAYGQVILIINFDESGHAKSTKIVQSPSEILSQLASDAGEKWQVYPSCKNGRFITQQAQVPFDFSP